MAAASSLSDLFVQRDRAADEAYEAYDFGAPIEGAQGWEMTIPGSSMTRTVYLCAQDCEASPNLDNDSPESVVVTLTVQFASNDSAAIAKVYATDRQGNDVGDWLAARPVS